MASSFWHDRKAIVRLALWLLGGAAAASSAVYFAVSMSTPTPFDLAQQGSRVTPGAAAQAEPTQGKETPPAFPFSNGVEEILKMVEAGADAGAILAHIGSSPVVYRLSGEEIVALDERGVPSDIILAMVRRGAALQAQAKAEAAAAEPLAAPNPPPAPVAARPPAAASVNPQPSVAYYPGPRRTTPPSRANLGPAPPPPQPGSVARPFYYDVALTPRDDLPVLYGRPLIVPGPGYRYPPVVPWLAGGPSVFVPMRTAGVPAAPPRNGAIIYRVR
jgi:hypothetical protein